MAQSLDSPCSLDGRQEQGFINFFNKLSEKPSTTIRFFDRNDYYTLHGNDALFAAKEVFKSLSVVKTLGSGTKKLESVILNKTHFEKFVRELLIVKHYCVEIYSGKSGSNEWTLQYQASPGNLTQLEELIFENADLTTATGILAVKISRESGIVGCCYVDTNARKLLVSEFPDAESLSNLESLVVQLSPKEILIPTGEVYESAKTIAKKYNLLLHEVKKADFVHIEAVQDLNRLLKFKKGQQENAAAIPEVNLIHSMAALAALVKYLNLTSDESNINQFSIAVFDLTQYVRLDAAAATALHLTTLGADSVATSLTKMSAPRTISSLLNKCRTSGGQRLLAQWILQPLIDKSKIEERLDIVETFVEDVNLRQTIAEDHLRRMPDFQKLSRKLQKKKANLQDCYRIYQALTRLPVLLGCLQSHNGSHNEVLVSVLVQPLNRAVEKLSKLKDMIETTVDLKQAELGEFVIKSDFDEQLGELRSQMDECESNMQTVLAQAARDLNLEASKTIKLESNAQFGYYFRVTLKDEKVLRNNRSYRTIDTNKNGVRFRNSALEEINENYIKARQEYEIQQQSVVKEILEVATGYTEALLNLNDVLSHLDVLMSFAVCSINAPIPYVRPKMLEKGTGSIEFQQLRHPCMELQDGVNFIPNDAVFRKDGKRFYLITGPNMGGKSTYLRSVGVGVLLAQIGCFVPAQSATISVVDAILARVGAGDCHMKGVSTFMAEMIETSNIIRMATEDSLVIIDELGRGTSTFDGFGLAWAIAEHISTKIKPYALFATHFHELTALASEVDSVANVHVSALTGENTFTLLYRLQPGSCDQSFGIHVAEMVHFPQRVLECAKMKATELEALQTGREETGESDSKRPKIHLEEGHALMRQYIRRAKAAFNSPAEMEALRLEVKNSENSFIQSLLRP